jgi:hypothetical protein
MSPRERDATQDRGHRKQEIPAKRSRSAPRDVTEPSDADDQGGNGEEKSQNDPLDLLGGGVAKPGVTANRLL